MSSLREDPSPGVPLTPKLSELTSPFFIALFVDHDEPFRLASHNIVAFWLLAGVTFIKLYIPPSERGLPCFGISAFSHKHTK